MKTTLLLLALACCGDDQQVVTLLDAPPDACDVALADANVGCCALYPDQDAIRACAAPDLPEGSCGVLACAVPGACDEFLRINFCHALPDAGPPGDAP
jgi:hypothetical protein